MSNLVGLDEQVTVDGNDKVQKSSFSLTPTLAKSSSGGKGKKQSKLFANNNPTTSRKRQSFDSHRNSVSKVSDMRLHKRGKTQKEKCLEEDDECIIVDPEAVEYELSKPSNTALPQKASRKKSSSVTPSPHPRSSNQQDSNNNLTPVRNTTGASRQRNETSRRTQPQGQQSSGRGPNSSTWSKNTTSNRRGPRNARSSWFQEKTQQKTSQQTAFHSPKENPFQSYSFDPNNIENSLFENAEGSKQSTIIPDHVSASTYSRAHSRPNNTTRGQTFRTPATHRRKGVAASNRISAAGLLAQKAAELQQQHMQTQTSSRNYTNRGSMQRNMMVADAPSVMNQYEQSSQSFNDPPNQFMGSGMMMSQNNQCNSYFQGTSSGSVMQQSFCGAPEQKSLTPPFMGRSNNSFALPQTNNFMRGSMAGMTRPMSSAGQSIASRLLGSSHFGHTNLGGGMISQQQQQQFQFQPQMQQDFGSVYNNGRAPYDMVDNVGFHQQQGMSQFQQQDDMPQFQPQMYDGGQHQQQFDDTFNDPICHGLDPSSYGDVGDGVMNNYQSFGGLTNVHDHSFGNTSVHPQQALFSGGGGHVHNPYQQQPRTQSLPPSNPYNRQQSQQNTAHVNPYVQHQQPQQPAHNQPPMQEVIVQNASVRSGLPGDDNSQFEDAFFG